MNDFNGSKSGGFSGVEVTPAGRQALGEMTEAEQRSLKNIQDRIDFELANGAHPLDELLAALDGTTEEWSAGGALYGPGGLFNDQRKALLAVTAQEIREMMKAQGGKCTDGLIDEMAHADPEYRAWLDKHEAARKRWLAVTSFRDDIQARIMRGNALLRVAARFVA